MRLRRIAIKNFRGIQELTWSLADTSIFCLIGKGDSAKTTVLEGIRYVFFPQWNLSFVDSDFFSCNPDNSIKIEATIGDLPEEFQSLDRYGHYLRGWDKEKLILSDEPDGLEPVLSVRLTVDRDLEPRWRVVCDRYPEGVNFKSSDRNEVAVTLIGSYTERQLTWATGTPLSKLTESTNLDESLVNATRAARACLDEQRDATLKHFDDAAKKSEAVAKALGVPVTKSYQAHLDLNNINIKIGGLTLHDGDMPLRLLGLGSRRMLLCGIQQLGLAKTHITLFDEVEVGLEPHRIARLIKHIKADETGQYLMTTHSPAVLRELDVGQLHIVHNRAGQVQVTPAVGTDLGDINAQGNMRSSAEAFLSKNVIVCEGATEAGFLRGWDELSLKSGANSFSYQGVALLDAHGAAKIKSLATGFKHLGYVVAVVADGDAPDQFSQKDAEYLQEAGIEVLMWSERQSIEQRVLLDLPWKYVLESIKLAGSEFGTPVLDQIRSKSKAVLDIDVDRWVDSDALRVAIGTAAKSGSWFKSIAKAERWFDAISPAFSDPGFAKTDIVRKLNLLRKWVDYA
jgi:putative ATP-dependent endonuclease of the OLD family